MEFSQVVVEIMMNEGKAQALLGSLRCCVVLKARACPPNDPEVERYRQLYNRLANWLWRKGKVRRDYLFLGSPPEGFEALAAARIRQALVARMTNRELFAFTYYCELHPKVQALPLPTRLKEFIQFG